MNSNKDSPALFVFSKILGNAGSRFYTCHSEKREINHQAYKIHASPLEAGGCIV